MRSYRLTYFNGRGRAEIARLLFAVAGEKYEDKRLEQNEWPTYKPKTSFGVLPNLTIEEDGTETSVAMSQAIANHLAREFGLYGKSAIESTRIDTTCNALTDIINLMYSYFFAKEKDKEECKKKCVDKTESYVVALESFLSENCNGDGYFAGDSLSLADIAFFNAFSEIKNFKPDALDKTPKLKALMDRVASNEKIAKWLETRPQTPF